MGITISRSEVIAIYESAPLLLSGTWKENGATISPPLIVNAAVFRAQNAIQHIYDEITTTQIARDKAVAEIKSAEGYNEADVDAKNKEFFDYLAATVEVADWHKLSWDDIVPRYEFVSPDEKIYFAFKYLIV